MSYTYIAIFMFIHSVIQIGFCIQSFCMCQIIITIIIIMTLFTNLPTVLFHNKVKNIYKMRSDLPIGRAHAYLQKYYLLNIAKK